MARPVKRARPEGETAPTKAKEVPKLANVYPVRVAPEIFEDLRRSHRPRLVLPPKAAGVEVDAWDCLLKLLKIGDRLFVREWTGGPTGRAMLAAVEGIDGRALFLFRTWGWGRDKFDDDLKDLAYVVDPAVLPVIGGAPVALEAVPVAAPVALEAVPVAAPVALEAVPTVAPANVTEVTA